MMLASRLRITACERRHRSALLDLVWRSHWTHQHLDWQSLDRWLDRGDGLFSLAWDGERLAGCLGLSRTGAGVAWLRLLSLRDGLLAAPVIDSLWRAAVDDCREKGIHSIMALMLTDWLPAYMPDLGFVAIDEILSWSLSSVDLPVESPPGLPIRQAEIDDLDRIAALDELAFRPAWRMTAGDLRDAWRAGASLSYALIRGRVVGYQLSLREGDAGHIARLATLPEARGQGIGAALLRHLLLDFRRRGISQISVNTQRGNRSSQRLYQRFGFQRSGMDFEVWNARLSPGGSGK